MNKQLFFVYVVVLSIFGLFLTAGCVSAPVSSVTQPSSGEVVSEKAQPESVCDDWEYRGFGRKLPDWVISAIKGGIDEVKKDCPEYAGQNIVIISTAGINPDHAEHLLMKKIGSMIDVAHYELKDSIWVHLNSTENTEKKNTEYQAFCLYKAK
jgi:hypothetical protein